MARKLFPALVAGLVLLAANRSDAAFAIAELAGDVERALATSGDESQRLGRVEEALAAVLARGTPDPSWTPHPGLDVTTYMLHADESFSIAVLVIRPGASTPVHDHGTWTVWGTLSGKDRETRFALRTVDTFPDPVAVAERVLSKGDMSRIPGPPDDLHRLENVGDGPSVSIHVHGADMRRQARHAYDLERRRVTSFVQSYAETGARE